VNARISIVVIALLAGCGAKTDLSTLLGADADADADTDADTDADVDADTDADVDADGDADGDADPDCGVEFCNDAEICCVEDRCVPVGGCCVDEECPEAMTCRVAAETCGVEDLGCGIETLDVHPIAPNFVILLDRSGSMNAPIDGRSKWDIAIDSLGEVLPQYEADVRFGLMMFPGPLALCDAGIIDVDVDEQNADDILDVLEDSQPLQTTPMGASLDALGDYDGLRDEDRRNLVLLVTDGEESCGGEPITETQLLFQDDIQVYVLGFGSEVDEQSLSEIAEAGRTDRPGNPNYYQAEDADELSGALDDIVASVMPCAYQLEGRPPLPNEIFVFFDDRTAIPRDRDHVDGWDFDRDTNVVTFFGPTCEAVKTDLHLIQVLFGCPD
jgi:hypothetical protein